MTDGPADSSAIPPVERVRQEVDRWLDAVRTTGERAMETLGLTGHRPSIPATDVVEFPEEVRVQIDLPGVSAEQVDLSLVGNMLTVVATRPQPELPGEARAHQRERVTAKFQRSVPLPAAVNHEAISAETRDGVLTVSLRKLTPTSGRTIPVSHGGGGR